MNKRNGTRLAACTLCLRAGGGIAWLVLASIKESLATTAARPMRHLLEDQDVLSAESPLCEVMTDLERKLEDGSVRIADIVDTSTVLLDAVKLDMSASGEGVDLPLLSDGSPFGHLRKTGPDAQGVTTWAFEITLPPLPRYG